MRTHTTPSFIENYSDAEMHQFCESRLAEVGESSYVSQEVNMKQVLDHSNWLNKWIVQV